MRGLVTKQSPGERLRKMPGVGLAHIWEYVQTHTMQGVRSYPLGFWDGKGVGHIPFDCQQPGCIPTVEYLHLE